MAVNAKLSKRDCPSEQERKVMKDTQKWYISVVATFIWFVCMTRPDLAFPVSVLCRFMHNPGKAHVIALKRMLRYLSTTIDRGLLYDFSKPASDPGIIGYFDAAHADCPDTLRSTCAYVFLFDGAPISWHTKRHGCITTSTDHSETAASAKAGREAVSLTKKAEFLGLGSLVRPIKLYSDSKGSISMVYNPISKPASKHIALSDYYARELIERNVIVVVYVSTEVMLADVLTKPLGHIAFARHTSKLIAPSPF